LIVAFREISGAYLERSIRVTEATLLSDFKNGLYYISHDEEAFAPVASLEEIVEGARYFMVGDMSGFMDNYAAVNEIEAGEAARSLLHLAGLEVHHHSGCVVKEGKVVRMDTDSMLVHAGSDRGEMTPGLEDVHCDDSARQILRKTILNLEVKSAITGRDRKFADSRVRQITTQIEKAHGVWSAMKQSPDSFKMTTRFGENIDIPHFTHARYMIWGVAAPLFNPYAAGKFRSHQPHPILPFHLSGVRYVPSFSAGVVTRQSVINGPLALFRLLKPFFRPL
jgi:hypothetical protein